MRADGPEEAVAIYGLGRLLRLNVNESEGSFADAEIVPPERMPEGRHTLRSTLLTETAYAPDWSRVLICGWKKPPKRPFFYQHHVWQTVRICTGMNAILRGENAVLTHCAVLETDRGAILLFEPLEGEKSGKNSCSRPF